MAAAVHFEHAWNARVEGAEGVCSTQTHNYADGTLMALEQLDCFSATSLCFHLCLPVSVKLIFFVCLWNVRQRLFLKSALVAVYSRKTGVA